VARLRPSLIPVAAALLVAALLIGLTPIHATAATAGDSSGATASRSTVGPGVPPLYADDHVTVYAGQPVARIVAAAAPGTTFLFEPGVYTNVSIVPQDGQKFIGEAGTTFDGLGQTTSAFSGNSTDVLIDNFVITNYANGPQHGAIAGDDSHHWRVFHNEIDHSDGTGIRVGDNMIVRYNWVHHNHQLGIGGGGVDAIVGGNEIANNNYLAEYDPGWEAGGAKFVMSTGLVVINNDVHNNVGPGLWTDIGNVDTLYYGNYVHDNDYAGASSSAGIFHEISGSATIQHNIVINNGNSWTSWGWNGGIQIAASSDVAIFDNVVLDNPNGITVIQQDRYAEWPAGARNISVYGNTIRTTGLTGAFEDTGEDIFSTRNIAFANNTFLGGGRFQWANGASAIPASVGLAAPAFALPTWAVAQLAAASAG
jgi:hypothetical protein